ncbi:MAG: hypothetical protein L0Y50_05710 [Beijerinckiaceae bacterium]|nr:hypothetical protein [Beijerinckiaceae bacterium]MCI0735755.1 hypothetical protein [Beijerinckiaceae bacterium]
MVYQAAQILKSYGLAGAVALSAALLANGSAFAGPKVFAFSGSTLEFGGSVDTTASGNADPFFIETFSQGSECLQILVKEQNADLEATLVSPDGATWRDDNSAGGNRPLINAVTTRRGWHILRLSHFNGNPVNAFFTVAITRNVASVCNPVTPPVNTFAPVTRKAGPAPQPRPGGPSSR